MMIESDFTQRESCWSWRAHLLEETNTIYGRTGCADDWVRFSKRKLRIDCSPMEMLIVACFLFPVAQNRERERERELLQWTGAQFHSENGSLEETCMQCTCRFSSQQQAQEETGSASAQQLRHDGHGCLRVPPALQPHDHQINRLELFLLLLTTKELSVSCCCCLSDEEFKQARISGPAPPPPPCCCMHLMIRLLTCCWYFRSLLQSRDLFLMWNCWSLSWHPSEREIIRNCMIRSFAATSVGGFSASARLDLSLLEARRDLWRRRSFIYLSI